jgi:hypothetical protein
MGKGGSQKVEVTEYYMSQHFGVCAGPVDAFRRIIIKEKEAWSGNVSTNSSILLQEDNLFGGATKEGGATGTIYFLPGASDQILPDALATRLGRSGGSDAPGYRGIASVWFTGRPDVNRGVRGFYWSANSPYLPGVWVTVRRAAVGLDPAIAMIGGSGDPYFENVVLLSGFQGDDGSTDLIDESIHARTITAVGDAQVDTAQSRFDGSSLYLDGTGDRASCADSDDWDFGTGPFTIECWLRAGATPTNYGIISHGDDWALYVGSTTLRFLVDGSSVLDPAYSPPLGNWIHIAVTRNASSVLRMWVDGVEIEEAPGWTTDIGGSSAELNIGTLFDPPLHPMNGHLDEIRITKGVCRYESNFTPPAAAFPRSYTPADNANPAHIIYECLTNTDWGMGSTRALGSR